MEKKRVLTYYDDIAGINSEVSKITEDVKEYITGFMTKVEAEADRIRQSKNEAKSKTQETRPFKKPNNEKARHQENKALGKVGSEKAKSKKKTKLGNAKSRQKNTKTLGKEDTHDDDDDDDDGDTLEEAFSKSFHIFESKPFVKHNEANAEKNPSSHTGAKAKTLTNGTVEPSNQNKDDAQGEKASPCEDFISSNKENNPEIVKLSKPLADMAAVLKAEASKKNIYAVKLMKGGMRSAKFSIHKGRLLLHRLRKKHPPQGVFIVQHSDVMKLVDPSSRLTFLELSEDQCENYGNMYIRLFGDSAGARQFSYLCTGEKGPSLGNTTAVNIFNEIHEKLEYVRFGDYEYCDGTGGAPLVPGLEVGSSEYVRPWVAGTLEGGWMWKQEIGAQFDILLKDNPGRTCQAAFGQVEEGLEKLEELVACNSGVMEFVYIQDCGIVLPC